MYYLAMADFIDDPDKKVPFFEWCKEINDLSPLAIVEKVSELVSKCDEENMWEYIDFIAPDIVMRDFCDDMLERMAANDFVTTSEMNMLYAFNEIAVNAIRLNYVLNSELIADFDDDERHLAAATISLAMRAEDMKIELCADSNGPSDLSPVLFYQYYKDGDNSMGTAIVDLSCDPSEESNDSLIYANLQTALLENLLNHGKPGLVAIVADSFIRETTIDDPNIEQKAASIKSDFQTVPDTDVQEAIAIMMMDPLSTDKICFLHCAYGYDDNGMPSFRPAGRSIQMTDRSILDKDPSHRGKMGAILYDFVLENKGL